jgi:eukaryotic-like serine/threonine-protein kinase
VRVVKNVGLDFNGAPLVSVSPTGVLAYVPSGTGTSRLVWVSREGAEQPITDTPARYQSPRLPPDGNRIAVNMSGNPRVFDITRKTFTRMTADDSVGLGFTAWDPRGTRVAFRSRTGMRWIDVDSARRSQPLLGSTGVRGIPNSIGPDGDTLAFTRQDGETSGDVYVASLMGRSPPRPVVRTPAYEGCAQLSPDGRWLAYASNESGRFQVYVRPFDESQRRFAVSSDGGSYALWRRDGRELFYRNGNKMMAVTVCGVERRLFFVALLMPSTIEERRRCSRRTQLP